jgi:hypothetical protein
MRNEGYAVKSHNHEPTDEQIVGDLDRAWNEVYLHNDLSRLESILADDFVATFRNGLTATKADLMRPTRERARVTFSEAEIRLHPPTAITYGRVRIEHRVKLIDQHYVRVYSKRGVGWQAVAVFVFPVVSPVGSPSPDAGQ